MRQKWGYGGVEGYWKFRRQYWTEDVNRLVLVTGQGQVDVDFSLEITAPSLGGGRREKIQEEGSDMNVKNC